MKLTIVKQEVSVGLATFVRKKHVLKKTGNFFIYKEKNSFVPTDYFTLAQNLHYIQLSVDNTMVTVCNLHGTAMPGSKLDTLD